MAEGDSGQVFDAARDDRDRHPEMLRCECDHGTVGGAAGCEHIDEPSAVFDAGVVGWDSQQRLRQRSIEGADHLGERPGFDDPPRLQQRDGIADAFDHVHLVGDHQNGQIELGAQIEDQVEDLVGGAGVEGGGGFVAQEHGGFGRQRPRDTDPLPLPARQLRRVGVRRVRQPDELILLSPWVDITHTNPDIAHYADVDPLMEPGPLTTVGESWAGDTPTSDWHLSPINGDLSALHRVTTFVGSRELFLPDNALLHDRLVKAGGTSTLHVGENLNHVYPSPEGRRARREIARIVSGRAPA